jgi:dienelactone hydrolase
VLELVSLKSLHIFICQERLMAMIKLFPTTLNPVTMDVFSPPTGTVPRGASVVVAYGTDGLSAASKPLIENFCRDLAKAGYTAALPQYMEITHTKPGLGTVSAAITTSILASWTSALAEGLAWCDKNQGNNGRIGLIGFSLGGYMAARTALATPVKCLIDFFGPMTTFGEIAWPTGEEFDISKAAGLPPTQIHHGNQDKVVDPSESTSLQSWLKAKSIECELHTDYNCGHPQQLEGTPWTAAEQRKATPRVLKFLATM